VGIIVLRTLVWDLLSLAGFALLIWAGTLVWLPLGLFIAGGGVLALGLWAASRAPPEDGGHRWDS